LERVGERRLGPAIGPGRNKIKCSNPRPQAEAEDNEYHRASKRNTRDEEVLGRVKRSANVEAGKIGANGTPSRERNTDDHAFEGGEEEHGASTDRVCNNDLGGYHSESIRSAQREGCTSPGKRNGTCKQVPQPSRGC
jgi:hypothetical protein